MREPSRAPTDSPQLENHSLSQGVELRCRMMALETELTEIKAKEAIQARDLETCNMQVACRTQLPQYASTYKCKVQISKLQKPTTFQTGIARFLILSSEFYYWLVFRIHWQKYIQAQLNTLHRPTRCCQWKNLNFHLSYEIHRIKSMSLSQLLCVFWIRKKLEQNHYNIKVSF